MSAQGMATADTFYGKPKAFENSIFFKSFECIMRAGGSKSALRTKQRRDDQLIYLDNCNKRKRKYSKNGFHSLIFVDAGEICSLLL